MRIIKAIPNCLIRLGKQGEDGVTSVVFDLSEFQKEFGVGTVDLAVEKPNSNEVYPVSLEINKENNSVSWIVSNSDLTNKGKGRIQLSYFVDNKLAKSQIYYTNIMESLETNSEAPTPIKSWIDEANKVLGEAREIVDNPPKISENNTWLLYDNITNKYIDTNIKVTGKSAYEIALDKGFIGTEEEWLDSLKFYPTFDLDPETGDLSVEYGGKC